MELCSIVCPGLTAVRQPLKEMMKAACDILEKGSTETTQISRQGSV